MGAVSLVKQKAAWLWKIFYLKYLFWLKYKSSMLKINVSSEISISSESGEKYAQKKI